MARGQLSAIGSERVAANGYHYTKVKERGWVLTHWLTWEKVHGREINPEKESVRFANGFSKKDYANPDAVIVVPKRSTSLRKQKAQLEARIQELQAELSYIDEQLEKLS